VLHRPVELAGDIGNFDPGHSMQTPQTNSHFSEFNFHLKRLAHPKGKLSNLNFLEFGPKNACQAPKPLKQLLRKHFRLAC
jgi:hypothetical protein